MHKIISLFQRNYDGDRLVRNEVVPGAEWVLAGEGIATRKYDGECHMIRGGLLFKRYDCKIGRTAPPGFEPCQEPDPVTGHQPGWVPCDRARKEDRWAYEAFDTMGPTTPEGTYELCGPMVQCNREGFTRHVLVPHGKEVLVPEPPRTFEGLQLYFAEIRRDIEGIVWWHKDGRMVKIKAKDFGLQRRTP